MQLTPRPIPTPLDIMKRAAGKDKSRRSGPPVRSSAPLGINAPVHKGASIPGAFTEAPQGKPPEPLIAPNSKEEIPEKPNFDNAVEFGPVFLYVNELNNKQKDTIIKRIPSVFKEFVAKEEGFKSWCAGMRSLKKHELREALLELATFQTNNVVIRL